MEERSWDLARCWRPSVLRTGAGTGALIALAMAAVAAAPASESSDGLPLEQELEEAGEPAPSSESPRPDKILVEPAAATVELFLKIGREDRLKPLLLRSGVAPLDAERAATLVAEAAPAGIAEDAPVAVLLGDSVKNDRRRLERLSVEAGPALRLVVGRDRAGELRLVREALAVDATPRRFRGRVGSGLFWALRSAGVPAEAAREYVEALSTRVDAATLRPNDAFDLVVEQWRIPNGSGRWGPILYAALDRADGPDLHLVRWTVGGRTDWFEPGRSRQRVDGFERPVSGNVSSRFGYRLHPILRIGRFHEGVDYRASWGSPVVAADGGMVIGAGWNGGHGRQVRLAHPDGITTSYSHLSRIAAAPGTHVRRGQVIGYVGSTGFSTGAHLHYEVRKNGRPVDPLGFRHSTYATIGATDLAALHARLQQLRSL